MTEAHGSRLDPEAPASTESPKKDAESPAPTASPKKKEMPNLRKVLYYEKSSADDQIPFEDLKEAFREIDVDGGGCVDLSELVESLQRAGLNASQAATEMVFKEIDKNMSGDVDLHEFVEFFRHMDDIDEFDKRRQQRAKFANFLLNFCFVADLIAVAVFLLMFIRMDEAASPDNYQIAQNLLMGCSLLLAFLFLGVIVMPIVRLTIGPTASNYYQKRVEARLARMHNKKPEEDPEGPRKAARAKMQAKQIHMASESTWRLKKHQALTELARQQYLEAQALEGTRTKSKHSAATVASDASHAITLPQAQQSDFEVLDRNDPNSKYDASAYFQAQSDQFDDLDRRGGRLALTFNPMQVDYGHQSAITSEGRALQYMDAERLPGTVQRLALANH